jgi:hypothetical protein
VEGAAAFRPLKEGLHTKGLQPRRENSNHALTR